MLLTLRMQCSSDMQVAASSVCKHTMVLLEPTAARAPILTPSQLICMQLQHRLKHACQSLLTFSCNRRIEELGLLSKVEELGLLSKLESSGLTLSQIEKSGLLSKAEKAGILTLVADK